MYPPLRTIPQPQPPCRTRRLPQARPSTESGTAPPGPWDLHPGHPGRPSSSWSWFGEAEAIRSRQALLPRRSSPEDRLGPLHMSPLFPPSLESLSDPREPSSQEGVRGGPQLLAGTKEGSPVLRSQVGIPFSTASSRPRQSPGLPVPSTEPLSNSGTSSPQFVCPVRPQVHSVGGAGPFVPRANSSTHTAPSCWPEGSHRGQESQY